MPHDAVPTDVSAFMPLDVSKAPNLYKIHVTEYPAQVVLMAAYKTNYEWSVRILDSGQQ